MYNIEYFFNLGTLLYHTVPYIFDTSTYCLGALHYINQFFIKMLQGGSCQ